VRLSARLIVTGISYGGSMTSWTIGHTGRFAAAIPDMLVGNLVSFFGTSDVGTWSGRTIPFVHR
jgi:dipeptidyl aminopeptidase/acylaminoacyl peptidase